jgi:hypothetical protein
MSVIACRGRRSLLCMVRRRRWLVCTYLSKTIDCLCPRLFLYRDGVNCRCDISEPTLFTVSRLTIAICDTDRCQWVSTARTIHTHLFNRLLVQCGSFFMGSRRVLPLITICHTQFEVEVHEFTRVGEFSN